MFFVCNQELFLFSFSFCIHRARTSFYQVQIRIVFYHLTCCLCVFSVSVSVTLILPLFLHFYKNLLIFMFLLRFLLSSSTAQKFTSTSPKNFPLSLGFHNKVKLLAFCSQNHLIPPVEAASQNNRHNTYNTWTFSPKLVV